MAEETESRELVQTSQQRDVNPFGARRAMRHINEGAVAVESERAIAEAQAAFIIAMRNTRDEALSYQRFMDACSRPAFAAQAIFAYDRGGSKISGPSIRFAEEAGRCWGNIIYGMLELSNKDGVTEMQAFAHDLETNVRSIQNFTVRHIRDVGGGGKALTQERDIYEIGANMGSRRMRARILAILPADYVDDGVNKCRETMANRDAKVPVADRIKAMLSAFSKIDVTADMIATKLGHPLDATTPQELDDLRGVLTAIKEGVTSVAEHFGAEAAAEGKPQSAAGEKLANVGKGAAKKADPKPEPAKETPQETAQAASPPPPPPPPPAEEAPPTGGSAAQETASGGEAGTDAEEEMF